MQLNQYKQEFINKLNNQAAEAENLYQLAHVMTDYASVFKDKDADIEFMRVLEKIHTGFDNQVRFNRNTPPWFEARGKINSGLHEFLTLWLDFSQKHGNLLIFEKGTGEVDLTIGALQAKPFFINSYGFPVHWTQDIIARACVSRVENNFDNLILTYGRRGFGKDTWNDEVAFRMCEIMGRKFDMDKQFIVDMPKHALFNYIKTWKRGDVYLFSEFVNQANARTAMSWDAIQLMELIVAIRKVGATAFLALPDLSMLDVALRKHMLTMLVRITERGKAIVMAPTLEETNTMKDKPDSAIILPHDLTSYVEKNATNKLLTSTFYPIPEDNKYWREMDRRARLGISTKVYSNRMNLGEERQKQFEDCLKAIPEGETQISIEWLVDYGAEVGYNIPPEQLAGWLSKKFNIKKMFILQEGASNLILNNDVIQRFIKKLRKTDQVIA